MYVVVSQSGNFVNINRSIAKTLKRTETEAVNGSALDKRGYQMSEKDKF